MKRSWEFSVFFLCLLFVSPQVYACLGLDQQITIFFNTNAQPIIFEDLGQSARDVEGGVESLPDGDVIAEVLLTDDFDEISPTAIVTANIVRVIKTTDPRIRQGEKIPMKFHFTSCGPEHSNGRKGTIVAKIGSDIEGRLVLCPYYSFSSSGHILLPFVNECVPSEIESARQIKLAAEQGDGKSQIALGLMYEQGMNVRASSVEALKWFRLAAESGDAEAMYLIGRIYQYGRFDVNLSAVEAAKWFGRAAEQGHDKARASKEEVLLTDVAEKGDAEAQYKLGKIYRRWNDAEAIKWLKLAAAQGSIEAMNELGAMYQVGSGVTQDYVEAVRWYRLAVGQGETLAKDSLAEMYLEGRGIDKNDVEAMQWLQQVAEDGNERAKARLEALRK